MKNKPTLILGIVFLLLLVYYLFTSLNPPEVTTGAHKVFEGILPEIDRIEFSSERRGDIVLEKQGGTWYLTEPFNFKAYDRQIAGMLESLFETFIDVDEVDTDPASHDRYSVGEKSGTKFKISRGDEVILDLVVGRQTQEMGHSYVRRAGSDTVELWRGMLSQDMVLNAEDWRDKVLFSINESDIISVEAVDGDMKRTLTLKDQIWGYTENGTEKPVDLMKAQSTVSLLAGLTGDDFASNNEIPRAATRNPKIYTTFTVRNGDKHTLEIWAPDDLSPRYLTRKSDGDVLYIVNNLKGEKMTLGYEQLK
jgi:hypothetical protein